jgi:hypothetical protein
MLDKKSGFKPLLEGASDAGHSRIANTGSISAKNKARRQSRRCKARDEDRRQQLRIPSFFEDVLRPKWPGRMFSEQVAEELGFHDADIHILISAGLLVPLGDPNRSSVKRFSREEILELGRDMDWLHRATLALAEFWRVKKHRE